MQKIEEFWIEVCYYSDDRAVFPFVGTQEEGRKRICQIVAMDSNKLVDFVLLLDGDWVPGTVARTDQIREDAQGYYVRGAKRYANG